MNTNDPDFSSLRDQWALKASVSEDDIRHHMSMDRNLNPHNDSYKPPLRTSAEVISDQSYSFADNVLMHQYGYQYKNWLETHGFEFTRLHYWKPRR